MSGPSQKKRPLSFYVNVLLAVDAVLIALVILSGGIDLKLGPLRLEIPDLRWPALALLALLVARRALLAAKKPVKEKGKEKAPPRWQDAFFGPVDSATERWRAVEVLAGITAIYLFFVGSAAVARHHAFATEAMGIGLAAQAAWNTVRGDWLATSLLEGGTYLGRHFSPLMAVLFQGYRLWEAPELLLRMQSLALGLGAWPVYLIAKERTGDRRWALALAILFIAHPAVRGIDLAGFHPAAFGVLPLLIAFYLLDTRRRWGGYLFILLALLCGEQLWLPTAFFGLYLCVVRRRWREGLFLFLLTFYGYIFLVSFGMVRLGGEENIISGRYSHLGTGMKEIFGTVFFNPSRMGEILGDPGRAAYLKDLFVPLAFLPLLGPVVLLFGLPLIALNILSGDPACWSVHSAHGVSLLPFLFLAAAAGLGHLRKGKIFQRLRLLEGPFLRWALLVLPLLAFGTSPAVWFDAGPEEGWRDGYFGATAQIPSDAKLSAQGRFVPHLAHRAGLSVFPGGEGSDLVLVERGGGGSTMAPGDFRDTIVELLVTRNYGVLHHDEHFLLLSATEGDRSPKLIKELRSSL